MSDRDWFVKAFGAAVDDIRKRLVEEPWFGREVTPPLQEKPMAHTLGWEQEKPAQGEPDRSHDVER
jgi:hypothetical protein